MATPENMIPYIPSILVLAQFIPVCNRPCSTHSIFIIGNILLRQEIYKDGLILYDVMSYKLLSVGILCLKPIYKHLTQGFIVLRQ